jgi:hypothetical protein
LERIENHQTEFFILNDTYNLQYVVWDSAHKDGADSVKWGHWELRKIPVRYGSEKKAVLIPITKKRYEFIDSVLKWGSWILMFLFFYFFIGLPIQILVNISRGKAFISKNIRRLKLMALIMGIYALVNTAGPYILGFFYLNTIPKEFSLRPFWQVLIEGFYLFLISIGIYIIALAFQRGYKLQQENSLTI